MGLFDKFLKKKPAYDKKTFEPESVDEILKIQDKYNLVVAMDMYISKKCNYGENMAALTESEKVIYITQLLEAEVDNGGFSQFFYNSSGNFSDQLIDAFSEIGAVKTAELCKKAVSAFAGKIPADWYKREEWLDEMLTDDVRAILDECDSFFYEYEEDLAGLNYEYIMKNKDKFI